MPNGDGAGTDEGFDDMLNGDVVAVGVAPNEEDAAEGVFPNGELLFVVGAPNGDDDGPEAVPFPNGEDELFLFAPPVTVDR